MRTERRPAFLLLLAFALCAAGCVGDPATTAPESRGVDSTHGVLVTNEGLWRQDNATLTFYSRSTGGFAQDWFARRNPGMRLGDLANGITIVNRTAWVAMTGSNSVEAIGLPEGRSLGRVVLGSGGPRAVAVSDDSTAFVTLVEGDAIAEFDTRTFRVRRRIGVGPAPEGIAVAHGQLLVAVSGYGFLRRREPGAGTIVVIDPRTGALTKVVPNLPNVVAIATASGGDRAYALYGLPHADSIGGVVELDGRTLDEIRRWEVKGAGIAGEMALDTVRHLIYVIDGNGDVQRVDPSAGRIAMFLTGAAYSPLGFYSIGVEQASGEVYAGFAASFTTNGEVVIAGGRGDIVGRFPAGLNPGDFGFY